MAKKSKKKSKKAKRSVKAKKDKSWKIAAAVIVVVVVVLLVLALSGTDEGFDDVIGDDFDEPVDEEIKIPVISGGPGFTMETALIVDADDSDSGIAAEYAYLRDNSCVNKGGAVEPLGQTLLEGEDGSMYDLLEILCDDGSIEEYYFQIDSFFGLWQE